MDRSIEQERRKFKDALAALNRFIIKQDGLGWTLMSKEDAMAEKDQLMASLKALETNQGANNQRAEDWFESSVKAFDYSCHARFWLREGTVAQKRDILASLGSNLTPKDRKLAVELRYPLPEIRAMLEVAPEMAEWFEPTKNAATKGSRASFAKKIPSLLPGRDSNPGNMLQRHVSYH